MAALALSHLLEQESLDLGPDMVEAGLPKAVAMRKAQVLLRRQAMPALIVHLALLSMQRVHDCQAQGSP